MLLLTVPLRISQNDWNTVGFQEVFVGLKCSRDRLVLLLLGVSKECQPWMSVTALSVEYDQSNYLLVGWLVCQRFIYFLSDAINYKQRKK